MRIFRFCTVDGTSPHVWVWFIYLDLDLGPVSTYKCPNVLQHIFVIFFLNVEYNDKRFGLDFFYVCLCQLPMYVPRLKASYLAKFPVDQTVDKTSFAERTCRLLKEA